MKALITALALCSSYFISAQADYADTLAQENKKYIAWASPSKATHVYGLMFNVWPEEKLPLPKIYGVEFNICPLGIFAPFLHTLYSLDINKLMRITDSKADSVNFKTFKKVNGLQIGLINTEPTIINGLDINASSNSESVTNGITISLASNYHYVINGLTFAVIGNSDYKCRGVQIALFNACADLKGVQIGLWNKNQKRSMPFINWCFR